MLFAYCPKRSDYYTVKDIKIPATEYVMAKDVQVGDVLFVVANVNSKTQCLKRVTVTGVGRSKPIDRPKDMRKTVFLGIDVVDDKGRRSKLGMQYETPGPFLVGPKDGFYRQYANAADARTKKKQTIILGWRSEVRTLVSRTETTIQKMRSHGTSEIAPYLDELVRILPMLIGLDERMTNDGGSDSTKDIRKPVHPDGRRRN